MDVKQKDWSGQRVADSEMMLGRGTIVKAEGPSALVQWDGMDEPMWTRWAYLDLLD